MELDPVHQRVIGDRPGVRRSPTKGLAVGLTATVDVVTCHGPERQDLDGINLDTKPVGFVSASDPDLGALPQPDRHGDLAGCDARAQVRTEPHARSLGDLPSTAVVDHA